MENIIHSILPIFARWWHKQPFVSSVTYDALRVSIACRPVFETVKREIESSDVNSAARQ